jgi:hypothetical protein
MTAKVGEALNVAINRNDRVAQLEKQSHMPTTAGGDIKNGRVGPIHLWDEGLKPPDPDRGRQPRTAMATHIPTKALCLRHFTPC